MELTNTYVVQDRGNQEELQRLIGQDHMVTTAMGGVLPEQQDPNRFHRVLDIGCGPGSWLLETAHAYPQIEKLYGIDISTSIVNHARSQAEQRHISTGPSERVEFLVMDALRMLEFPDNFFDLVNLRFGVSFMRQWDWPKMLKEMNRVTRVNSIIRIVEGEVGLRSTSYALSQFYELLRRAMYRAGHLFEEDPGGLINALPSQLVKFGFNRVEVRRRDVEYRTGTEAGNALIEDVILSFRTLRPYLRRYGCEPKNYDEIYKQATQDMQQPGFVAINPLTTIWAINPRETTGLNHDPGRLSNN
jgi:ubiquinone/menaquinone biosynthesis C-methylase UbiE